MSVVMDGWVTPSMAASSVIRLVPVRSSVDIVASEVRLMSRGARRNSVASSP